MGGQASCLGLHRNRVGSPRLGRRGLLVLPQGQMKQQGLLHEV